jgi:hypothetical protein
VVSTPVDDLQPAAHPVAGVADLARRAGAALERGGRDIVEHQRALAQVPGGQRVLDARLAGQQPVHRGVQVVLVAGFQAEQRAQRAGRGLGAQPAGGGELGGSVDDRRGDHRGDQVPLPGGDRADQLLHSQRAKGAEHRGHVPVRQAAADLERAAQAGGRRLALQHRRQRLHLGLGPGRQVGQGAVLDLAAFSVAFPQQHRRP